MATTYGYLTFEQQGETSGDGEGWSNITPCAIPAGVVVHRLWAWAGTSGESSTEDAAIPLRIPAQVMTFSLARQLGLATLPYWVGVYPCVATQTMAVRPNDGGSDEWQARVSWASPPVSVDMQSRFTADPSGVPAAAIGVFMAVRPVPLQDPDHYRYNSVWFYRWFLKVLVSNLPPDE